MQPIKSTPGPWDWDGQILVRRIQAGEGISAEHPHLSGEWDEVILGVLDDLELASDFVAGGGREYCDWSVSEANAHLIAAAPLMHLSLANRSLLCDDDFEDIVAAIEEGDSEKLRDLWKRVQAKARKV